MNKQYKEDFDMYLHKIIDNLKILNYSDHFKNIFLFPSEP